MSFGPMSSRDSAEMINSLISSSSGCTQAPPAEINGQIISQLPRGERFALGSIQERRNLDIFLNVDYDMEPARRNTIPLLAFSQRHGLAAQAYRGDVEPAAHGDVGGAALQARGFVAPGPGALGEDHQVASATHGTDAVVDQAGAVVVEHVPGRAHRAAGARVARQRRFDHA